jgi:hypothetical protein
MIVFTALVQKQDAMSALDGKPPTQSGLIRIWDREFALITGWDERLKGVELRNSARAK